MNAIRQFYIIYNTTLQLESHLCNRKMNHITPKLVHLTIHQPLIEVVHVMCIGVYALWVINEAFARLL